LCCAIAFAAAQVACGGGISLDPTSSKPSGDKLDGGDASEVTPRDASFEDTEEEQDTSSVDVSAPLPDANDDAAAEADTPHDDAHDVTIDGSDDVSADSTDGGSDESDDGRDGGADGEPGDGCTLGCGWPEADYYVDSRAPDGGDGSKQWPFKTISRAILAYANTQDQPKKAYVAPGTYDKALGEQFPLVLRGLSLEGAGREQTQIVGTGAFDHAAAGGPMRGQYLVTIAAGDRVLPTKISGVSLRPENPVPVQNYFGVFCDRGSATGEVAPPAGQTQLDAVTIGPGYHATVVATTSTASSVTGCSLSIRASTLTGGWTGVHAIGYELGPVSGPVEVEVGGPDPSSGNTVSWMQGSSEIASGARLLGGVSGSFQYNTFIDSRNGIYIEDPSNMLSGGRHFTIRHNTFERLTRGAHIVGTTVRVDEVSDNRFVGISGAAGDDPGNPSFALGVELFALGKVRRNHFIGNDLGVSVSVFSSDGAPADFGTAGDPGGNVFRCNSALQNSGADFVLTGSFSSPDANWAGIISMLGNAWDHTPPTQMAETIPNGCDIGTVRLPRVTLDLRESTLATQACPLNRVPGQ
jgi:hypothetical protein